MQKLELPYGKTTLPLTLEAHRLRAVLHSGIEAYVPPLSSRDLVAQAMENPVGCESLEQLSRGKRNITIIASDHTRPVPSKLLIPPMLEAIRRGNPDAEITILIATGCHRETSRQELLDKFGPEILEKETIIVHDCDDEENLCLLGTLPSGGACRISRYAAQADLLIAEGFIEPHFFAGYSGGRKSVLPGVAARETVLANHCSEFIAHPAARAGSLEGNPIHQDMLWAAEKAGLRFILNVVLDANKKPIYAVAGDPRQAHAAGCAFLENLCGVPQTSADIVITTNGGYPLDQNIYQAVKGMTAAEATVKPGGVIIMLAASGDGHGGEAFCRELMAGENMDALMAGILSRGRAETLPDQWQAQIMIRVLQKAWVIYISDAPDELVRRLHMIPAHSLEEAMAKAEEILGNPHADVTVIPDGVSVIVLPQEQERK